MENNAFPQRHTSRVPRLDRPQRSPACPRAPASIPCEIPRPEFLPAPTPPAEIEHELSSSRSLSSPHKWRPRRMPKHDWTHRPAFASEPSSRSRCTLKHKIGRTKSSGCGLSGLSKPAFDTTTPNPSGGKQRKTADKPISQARLLRDELTT
jgi:hypothetical protein